MAGNGGSMIGPNWWTTGVTSSVLDHMIYHVEHGRTLVQLSVLPFVYLFQVSFKQWPYSRRASNVVVNDVDGQ